MEQGSIMDMAIDLFCVDVSALLRACVGHGNLSPHHGSRAIFSERLFGLRVSRVMQPRSSAFPPFLLRPWRLREHARVRVRALSLLVESLALMMMVSTCVSACLCVVVCARGYTDHGVFGLALIRPAPLLEPLMRSVFLAPPFASPLTENRGALALRRRARRGAAVGGGY